MAGVYTLGDYANDKRVKEQIEFYLSLPEQLTGDPNLPVPLEIRTAVRPKPDLKTKRRRDPSPPVPVVGYNFPPYHAQAATSVLTPPATPEPIIASTAATQTESEDVFFLDNILDDMSLPELALESPKERELLDGGIQLSSRTDTSNEGDPPAPYKNPKRSLKKLEKSRRDKEREMNSLIKSYANMAVEDKYDNLCERYRELFDDYKQRNMKLYITEKYVGQIEKEKSQLQTDQSKLIMARNRLEGACRELQKQNKEIKENNSAKIREEEEKRKEISAKFQGTLNEVSSIMAQNTEKNTKLRDDNIDMSKKFQTLCKQFESREDQVTKLTKQMELEKKLADTHILKLDLELKAERELWLKEREVLRQTIKAGEEQTHTLQLTNSHLETELKMYKDKYDEFEATISKSNHVFEGYKREMSKLSKQLAMVGKESSVWKSRWEKNSKAIIEITEANSLQNRLLKNSETRLIKMQNLCRQLQMDRTAYLNLLRSNDIEPTFVSAVVDPIPPPETPKTQKERELELLKQDLEVLEQKYKEEALSVLAKAKPAETEEPAKGRKRRNRKRGKTSNDSKNSIETSVSPDQQNYAETLALPVAENDDNVAPITAEHAPAVDTNNLDSVQILHLPEKVNETDQ